MNIEDFHTKIQSLANSSNEEVVIRFVQRMNDQSEKEVKNDIVKIEISELKPGQKVNLLITDSHDNLSQKHLVEAIFVRSRELSKFTLIGIFALNVPFCSIDYNSTKWEDENKRQAIRLGIDISCNTAWEVDSHQDEETIVTKFEEE